MTPNIHMFIWRVLHDGVGVLNKLGKFIDVLPTRCIFCRSCAETVDHVFSQCLVAQAVLFGSPLNLRASQPIYCKC